MYDTLIERPLTQSQRRCMQLSWLYFCGICQKVWPNTCMNFTGYQLQRESSSNSAFWYTMQSMVVHRRIWPSWLHSRSQHPRTRLSPLSWETRSGCSAFETGLIRAGILRRCTKSVEWPALWLITDTKLFKKKLKTFLFNSAYHGIRQWNFILIEQGLKLKRT